MPLSTVIKPKLRLFDLTVIVTGLVIGMGIFRTPVEVASKAGQPYVFFAAWILGAVVSLIGAFVFAEIGSRFPHAGGFYKIFSHCYHPAFAFMVNWITVISNAASTALVALMGSEYLAPLLFPSWNAAKNVIAFIAVALLFLTNLSGIRMSSRLLNSLMFIKVGLLLILICSVFAISGADAVKTNSTVSVVSSDWWSAFFLCFIPVFFTYGGYQQTVNFGSDIRNANKTMPRAIILGMLIVMAIYLLVNYAYVHTLGFQHLGNTSTPAADISGMMFGEQVHKAVSLIMFLSVMAYVNVSMMSNPRVYYAMAEDEVMPSMFMKVNRKTQVQEFALVLFTVFILVTLIFARSFENLLKYVMFFDSIGFMSAAAAIFILRRKAKAKPLEGQVFSMRGYPYLPIIFIAVYATITITIFLNDPSAAGIGFALFLLGFPLYFIVQKLIKIQSQKTTTN